MKENIMSCLGKFTKDVILDIIKDGSFDNLGDVNENGFTELEAISEGSYGDGQIIEYRFNHGLTNAQNKEFYKEMSYAFDKLLLCEYRFENVTYMTHRIYFKLIK